MANSYIHGSFAYLTASDVSPAAKVGTNPVYIGTAPIHMTADMTDKVNVPIQLTSWPDALRKIGYSDDWAKYTLCEAVFAHFQNEIAPIGPITVINVLDPLTMQNATQVTASVPLIGGRGVIQNSELIRSSVDITGATLDADYTLDFDPLKGELIIQTIGSMLTSPLSVTYSEVTPNAVTKADIIGGVSTSDVRTGIAATALCYQLYNMIPTMLSAPGWDHDREVADALKANCQNINGHWYAYVSESLPADSANTGTIAKTIAYRRANGYVGESASVHWPCARKGSHILHLSTLRIVTSMQVDRDNDGIPFASPSNHPIDIDGLCLSDGTPIVFDQEQANELNSQGITTAIYWGGRWVLWGPHTERFQYNSDNDPRANFDVNIRMLYYIMNSFQLAHGLDVDKPLTRWLKDHILEFERRKIDALTSRGALLGGSVEFREDANTPSDLLNGDFLFDIATTITPPGKSITARVAYTDRFMSVYFEGGI